MILEEFIKKLCGNEDLPQLWDIVGISMRKIKCTYWIKIGKEWEREIKK